VIGEYVNAPVKERLAGLLQRHFIKKLVRKLSPMAFTPAIRPTSPSGEPRDSREMLPLFEIFPVNADKSTDRVMELISAAGTGRRDAGARCMVGRGNLRSHSPEWKPDRSSMSSRDAGETERKTAVIAGLAVLAAGGDRFGPRRWPPTVAASTLRCWAVARLDHFAGVAGAGLWHFETP